MEATKPKRGRPKKGTPSSASYNSEMFIKSKNLLNELQGFFLECKPNCATCYTYIHQLSTHLHRTHKITATETDDAQNSTFDSPRTKIRHTPDPEDDEDPLDVDTNFGSSRRSLRAKKVINYAELGEDGLPTSKTFLPEVRLVRVPVTPIVTPPKLPSSKIPERYLPSVEEAVKFDPQSLSEPRHNFILPESHPDELDFDVNRFIKTEFDVEYPQSDHENDYNPSIDDADDTSETSEKVDDPDTLAPRSKLPKSSGPPSPKRRKKTEEKPLLGCRHCGKIFKRRYDLNRHEKIHAKVKVKVASKEPKEADATADSDFLPESQIAKSKSKLKRRERGTDKPSLECNLCERIFATKQKLTRHLKTHGANKDYSCEFCDKNFSTLLGIENHVKTFHNPEKTYKCDECEKEFAVLATLEAHKSKHSNFRFKFIVTKYDGGKKQVFRLKDIPEGGVIPLKPPLERKKPHHTSSLNIDRICHKCGHCGREYIHKDRRSILIHLKNHAGIKTSWPCKICDKTYHSSQIRWIHMKTHTRERPYMCDVCGKNFKFKSTLNEHNQIHAEGRMAKTQKAYDISQTPEGRYIFRLRSTSIPSQGLRNLKEPTKIIEEVPISGIGNHDDTGLSFMCGHCYKNLNTRSALYSHMELRHYPQKIYKCDECGKEFKWSDGLKIHKRVHTGERPFMCDDCGKKFRTRVTLNEHKLIHQKGAPREQNEYSIIKSDDGKNLTFYLKLIAGSNIGNVRMCLASMGLDPGPESSGTTFNYSDGGGGLDVHGMTFTCGHCKKTFMRRKRVYYHMKIHTAGIIKKFPCEVCGHEFPDPKALRIHRTSYHGSN